MIKTYADYKHYCKVDAEANNYKGKHPRLIGNEIWKFLVALRRYEYVKNCINGGLKRILLPLAKFRWHMLSVKTGILIYPNTFEEGLTLWHYGCIVSHNTVRGGKRVTIQCGVNIAENVLIGNDVYLAPGAKISKNIEIGNNCIIGYNTVVTRSIQEEGTYIGMPAKKINSIGYTIDGIRRKI